jgi:fibronectin type 3 domain-containing protein
VALPAPLRLAILPALAAAPLLLAGCGKMGPPLPPIRIQPAAAQDLRVRQIGEDVLLTATLPEHRTDGTPLGGDLEVRVLRMPGTSTLLPGAVSGRYLQRQFEREAKVVARISGGSLEAAAPGRRLRFRDAGAASGGRDGVPPRYLYGILVIDGQGRPSALPQPAVIEAVRPPPVPRNLTAETAEGEVRLAWEGAGSDAIWRYNVYRWAVSDPAEPDRPLNPEPLAEVAFSDRTFRYGETYRYTVRALVARGGPSRESASASAVEVRPVDIYPPKAPTGLAVAAEGAVMKLYWFPNGEPDLGGYRVYRRTPPDDRFELAGQVGAADTSFADTGAAPGVRYYYVVTAIDGTVPPNESPRSEERSESLPSSTAPRPTPGAVPGETPRPRPGRWR